MSQEEQKDWKKTPVPNLTRYVPSGEYYARAKVGGKLFSKSLKTSTFSGAKLRLNDLLKERRATVEAAAQVTAGKMTFYAAAMACRQKVEASLNLKPRSKDFRNMTIDFIVKSWPAVLDRDVRKVTQRDCEEWLVRYQGKYAPSVVNNSIGTLRAIFEVAVVAGLRFDNPAARLKWARVIQKRQR